MRDVSIRVWRAAAAVSIVSAAVAFAGPSFAGAATFAKPAQPGAPGKTPPAHGATSVKAGRGEGIVQSVSANAIVLRELDGSTVSISVASSTHVFVNGKRASLRDVKAGFIASGAWKAGGSARVLQAFDLSSQHAVSVGVVDSVSSGVLVVTKTSGTSGTGGTTVSIPVNAKTRIFVDGKPATLAAVKTGYTVVIAAADQKGTKPAHELLFLQPV
jgi:hypothetical protein